MNAARIVTAPREIDRDASAAFGFCRLVSHAPPAHRSRPSATGPCTDSAIAMVLAVNCPPHAPAPGHAAFSTCFKPASSSAPAPCAPIASNTSWIEISLPVMPPRHDRAAVKHATWQIHARERHRRGWNGLVATHNADDAIELMALHGEFDGIGDDFARNQRRLHARRTHRDAVGDDDGVEVDRNAARFAHAAPHMLGQIAQMHVARRHRRPRVHDRDQRPRKIRIVQARRAQVRARRRPVRDRR